MILHHYELSPYSEKIRLMFGFAGMSWQSLVSPEMPPRPNVDPLTGGYRRMPVAQAGADIFCDTRIICAEVAAESGRSRLALHHCDRDVREYANRVERELFWAAVLSIPRGAVLRGLFKQLGWWKALRFLRDRATVGRTARVDFPTPERAAKQFQVHLEDMESRLNSSRFLFDDQPCIADFSAYHLLWFHREVGQLDSGEELDELMGWYKRMQALGHGDREEISQDTAFATARNHMPRTIPDDHKQDHRIGDTVIISPADYALDGVEGELVGVSPQRYVIERETGDFGTLHIHFPRDDFELNSGSA